MEGFKQLCHFRFDYHHASGVVWYDFCFVLHSTISGEAAYTAFLFYLPAVVTPAIIGQVFSKFFEANRGYLNTVLRALHLDALTQTWLADPNLALYCVCFVNIWQWTGYSMLLYYASMLNISNDLYESASLDGANKAQQFTHVTFPLLRGTHFTVFILGMLGSLKCYDIVFYPYKRRSKLCYRDVFHLHTNLVLQHVSTRPVGYCCCDDVHHRYGDYSHSIAALLPQQSA